jgi:hypothetical protein
LAACNKKGWPPASLLHFYRGLLAEQFLQFAGLIHLAHDVRPADEFAIYV